MNIFLVPFLKTQNILAGSSPNKTNQCTHTACRYLAPLESIPWFYWEMGKPRVCTCPLWNQ